MSLRRRLYCTYNHFLYKYPYRTQAVQVATLLGIGDVIAQTVVIRDKPYDYRRTIKFMSAGLFIGPSVHAWYLLLEKLFGRSRNLKTALLKVLPDQLIFAPISLAVLLTYVNVVNFRSADDLKKSFVKDYPHLLKSNYLVWTLPQIINFSIIQLNYRVIFNQTLGVLWNTYVSFKTHKKIKEAEEKCNHDKEK